jgi:hypothetical protein
VAVLQCRDQSSDTGCWRELFPTTVHGQNASQANDVYKGMGNLDVSVAGRHWQNLQDMDRSLLIACVRLFKQQGPACRNSTGSSSILAGSGCAILLQYCMHSSLFGWKLVQLV